MNFSKYLNIVLASIFSVFVTYYSVILLNFNAPSTGAEKAAYVFTIFSVIYTCGKLVPLTMGKLISASERLIKFIVKN